MPIPEPVKELRPHVTWDVSVPESQSVILPEKEGEEQSRKEEERTRTRLQKLEQEVHLSAADVRTYNDLKTEFIAMPWAQELTLRTIYKNPGIDLGGLIRVSRAMDSAKTKRHSYSVS